MKATRGRTTKGSRGHRAPKEEGQANLRNAGAKPPDFEIPEFTGGPHRKRYPLVFKLKVVEYAQPNVEGGNGLEGIVGTRYAIRALGITDEATLGGWTKKGPPTKYRCSMYGTL